MERSYYIFIRVQPYSNPIFWITCDEKLDFEFVRWILHDGRTKAKKEKFKLLKSLYADKVVVLKNQKQLDKFELSINK